MYKKLQAGTCTKTSKQIFKSTIIEFWYTCIAHNKNGISKCLHPVFGKKEANEHVYTVSKGKFAKNLPFFFFILDTGRLYSKEKFTSQCHVLEIKKSI